VYKRSLVHGKRQIHQLHELLGIQTEHKRAREAAAAARRQASTAGQQLEEAVANEAKMKQSLAGMTVLAKKQQAGESLS
jgi:hypothetical protein